MITSGIFIEYSGQTQMISTYFWSYASWYLMLPLGQNTFTAQGFLCFERHGDDSCKINDHTRATNCLWLFLIYLFAQIFFLRKFKEVRMKLKSVRAIGRMCHGSQNLKCSQLQSLSGTLMPSCLECKISTSPHCHHIPISSCT